MPLSDAKMTSPNASNASQPASFTNWSTVRGVIEDVNNIVTQTLELFDDTQTLRIKHFHNVWKSMTFGLVSTVIFCFFDRELTYLLLSINQKTFADIQFYVLLMSYIVTYFVHK